MQLKVHLKKHWSLSTCLFEDEVDAEDEDSVYDSVEHNFVTGNVGIPSKVPDGPCSPRNYGEPYPDLMQKDGPKE